MHLNGLQILEQGGPDALKAWIRQMNTTLSESPYMLRMAGPCSLPARARLGESKVSRGTQWTFDGGEDLVLQSVFQEPNIHRDTTVLKATFGPACEPLRSGGFANMTLEMDKAFAHFDGLEAWVAAQMSAAPKLPARVQPVQAFAPPIKSAELQASEEWGAW